MTIIKVICILSLLIFTKEIVICQADLPLSDIVFTTSGDVQGVVNQTVYGIPYSSFKGIPYAETPRRFQEPVAKSRALHIFEAFKEGHNCMQVNSITNKTIGSEDCLYLNVYTPYINLTNIQNLKAVVVWIHGGSFQVGSGDSCRYGPDGFISHGIVVVTINYRLGALGWLLTTDSKMPGNAGLKDQNLALKWVQNNIRQFGGDPEKVTLFGQSAASVSATAHVMSDKSVGLFRQVIAFSGTIYNIWGYNVRSAAQNTAFKLGKLINNNTVVSNNDQLYELLNNSSAEIITEKSRTLSLFIPSMKIGLDINSPNGSAFLNKCYDKKYTKGNYSIVPTLMGFTKNEVLLFTKNINDLVNEFKSYMTSLEQSEYTVLKLVSRYLKRSVNRFSDVTIPEAIDILSQVFFQVGVDLYQRKICSTRNSNEAPVYYYLFDFDAKNYSYHYLYEGITQFNGAGHEDELQYIWETCPQFVVYPKDPNHPVNIKKRQMTTLISNFIKYGNPTPQGKSDSLLKVTWPESCIGGHHLLIQDNLSPQFQRPIGNFTKLLMPFAKLRSSIQKDCHPSTI